MDDDECDNTVAALGNNSWAVLVAELAFKTRAARVGARSDWSCKVLKC